MNTAVALLRKYLLYAMTSRHFNLRTSNWNLKPNILCTTGDRFEVEAWIDRQLQSGMKALAE
jgi:hypothetical protein